MPPTVYGVRMNIIETVDTLAAWLLGAFYVCLLVWFTIHDNLILFAWSLVSGIITFIYTRHAVQCNRFMRRRIAKTRISTIDSTSGDDMEEGMVPVAA